MVVLGGVGVRWGLVEYRMIGERENDICGWVGICGWGDCGVVGGVIGFASVLAAFTWFWGDMVSLSLFSRLAFAVMLRVLLPHVV